MGLLVARLKWAQRESPHIAYLWEVEEFSSSPEHTAVGFLSVFDMEGNKCFSRVKRVREDLIGNLELLKGNDDDCT